jgi:hypothetical protein
MEAKWKGLSLAVVVAIAFLFALSGLAAAAGSGYDLSFSQAAGGANPNADLVAVSSNDPGGANLSVQFTVAGQIVVNSNLTGYIVWFGGSSDVNATADVVFSNNTTSGFYLGYGSSAGTYGSLPFTISGGGATLSFTIAKTILPSSSDFSLNAEAVTGINSKTPSASWLGSSYGNGATGSCNGSTCTTTPSGSTSSFDWWIVIIPVVVIVVIVAVVLMLVMRKKPPAPSPMMGQPGQPMGQPGWENSAPSNMGQNPPPPPPPGVQ